MRSAKPLSDTQRHGWRWVAHVLALLALLAVALSYFNPHLMVSLANQLWACF
jgi:hypothetical protein